MKVNQLKSYSVWQYIFGLIIISLFALTLFTILGNKTTTYSSFISSAVVFYFITIFTTYILLRSKKWLMFFTIVYLIKLSIGLFHYLYFIDPFYFDGSGIDVTLHFEFQAVFSQIITFANDKLENGLLYYNFYEGSATHQEILSFISIPFMYFGDYIMTFAPLNSFFSILISINIILISKYIFKIDNISLKYVAITSAYFPMTLISSLIYRDIIGIALMSIGLVLIFFSRKFIIQLLMLVIACYLFYLQRTIYPLILISAFIIDKMINQHSNSPKRDLLIKIFTIIITIIIFPTILNLSSTDANEAMLATAFNFNLFILPVKLILGTIGPFPWNQFLLYEQIPAFAYQLQDYLQGTFNLAVFVAIILKNKHFFKKGNLNLLSILGLLLLFSGLMTNVMHLTYTAIGIFFMIPWIFTTLNIKQFTVFYKYSFFSLILLNIIVIYLLGTVGISSLWR